MNKQQETRYTIEARTETGDWAAFAMAKTPEEAESEYESCKHRIQKLNAQNPTRPICFIRIKETTDVIRASFRLVTDFVEVRS